MSAIAWKTRRPVWYSGSTGEGLGINPDVSAPTTPTPAPGTPPPPPPPPASLPVVQPGQVFQIRQDSAVGTELGPVLATRSPTGFAMTGAGGQYWSVLANGRLKLTAGLPAALPQSYTLRIAGSLNGTLGAFEDVVVNVTAAPAPPPTSGGGGTGADGVPTRIANLAAAPYPSGNFTTGCSTDVGNEAGGILYVDYVRERRKSGPFVFEANTWNIHYPGHGGKGFQGVYRVNPASSLSGNQFHLSIAGNAVGQLVSAEIKLRFPNHLPTPNGTIGEVPGYPCIVMGQGEGWSGYQNSVVANLPKKFKDISSLYIGARARVLTGTAITGHLCHDLRACNTDVPHNGYNPQTITAELMIVDRIFNGYGNLTYRGTPFYRGKVTLAGVEFWIFIQTGATDWSGNGTDMAMLLVFVPTSGALPDIYNAAALIRYCCTTRYRDLPIRGALNHPYDRGKGNNDFLIDPERWLTQSCYGIEIDAANPVDISYKLKDAMMECNLD